jgi:hypothetical protein
VIYAKSNNTRTTNVVPKIKVALHMPSNVVNNRGGRQKTGVLIRVYASILELLNEPLGDVVTKAAGIDKVILRLRGVEIRAGECNDSSDDQVHRVQARSKSMVQLSVLNELPPTRK